MPKNKLFYITELEFKLLRVLWEQGGATVQELKDALESTRPLAYTTVLSTLQRMEEKGYVTHDVDGMTYVYRPSVEQYESTRGVVRDFVSRFFEGAPEMLLTGLLDKDKLTSAEMRHLRNVIFKTQVEREVNEE